MCEKMKWIDAKKRQPENSNPVLGYKDGGYVVCEYYGEYYDGSPNWSYTGLGGDPDFWMPVPEPPEKQTKDAISIIFCKIVNVLPNFSRLLAFAKFPI